MKTYHVAGWDLHYENNRSRKVKDLTWVPIPNKHDGERYSLLMTEKRAAEIFAAWILILQVASRCHRRGTLVRGDGRPHDAASLAVKTRAPKAWFEVSLIYLEKIGWLTSEVSEQTELPLVAHNDVTTVSPDCQSGDEEWKEGNRKNGMEQKEPAGAVLLMAGSIYDAYPRKQNRQAALKAIAKAMATVHAERLLERTEAYAAAVAQWPEEARQFIPHPATWFNKGGYDDDPTTWQRQESMNGRAGFA